MITEKKCSRCGETLPIDNFHKNSRNSTGYCSYCKVCANAARREWVSKDCNGFKDRQKQYKQNNKSRADGLRRQKTFQRKIRKIAAEGLMVEVKKTKVCSLCKVEQPIDNFNKDGKNCWCRECCKARALARNSLPTGVTPDTAAQIVADYKCLFENSLIKRLSEKYNLSAFQIRTVLKVSGVELKTHRVKPVTNGCYVYLHKTLDGVVFYVGKGTGDRAWSKFRNNKDWTTFTKNNQYVVEIYKDGLSESEAFELEQELFEVYKGSALNKVKPASQLENKMPENLRSHVFYDPSSPTKLRWNRDILTPHGGLKYKIGDIAGGFHKASGRGIVRLTGRSYYISRIVCELHGNPTSGMVVDHINGNCSDDSFENLRITTPVGNARNVVKQRKSNTGFVGVHEDTKTNTFIVVYRDQGKSRTKRFRFGAENRDETLVLAVEYRMSVVSHLSKTGPAYSNRHLGIDFKGTENELCQPGNDKRCSH